MKIMMSELRNIIAEELTRATRKRGTRTLVEGHTRITQDEISAWKSGNWGYVKEADDSSNIKQNEESSRGEFDTAIAEFIDGLDVGGSSRQEQDDVAENFFYSYPEWSSWSTDLNMSKSDMLKHVVEMLNKS